MKVTKIIPILSLAYASAAFAQGEFSNLIAFGDSLSDTGNAGAPAPYYMERFSNGPIWIDGFSAAIGHDAIAASDGGDNWAVGGATAGADSEGNTLDAQITGYLASVGGAADPDALYSVWIGGNDVNGAAVSSTPVEDLTAALTALSDELTELVMAGATNFLIPNLPDLGATPGAIAEGDAAQAGTTALTSEWNNGVAGIIAGLQGAGATVYSPDTFSASSPIFANPEDFGFSNSTGTGVGQSDPDDYVFYDLIHPSSPAHDIIGGVFLESVGGASSAAGPLGAAAQGDDYYVSSWLGGFFADGASNWVYHDEHGWLSATEGDGGAYLWDDGLGWLYTSSDTYPWLYVFGDSTWAYYVHDSSNGDRWFYSLAAEGWASQGKNE